jgi:hypothetical protein
MNDEDLIEELLADPTVTFAEAQRMAAARVTLGASSSPGSTGPSNNSRPPRTEPRTPRRTGSESARRRLELV